MMEICTIERDEDGSNPMIELVEVGMTMSDRLRSLNSLGDIEFAVKRIEELEAKLKKAVDALDFYADRDYVGYDVSLENYGLSIIVGEIIKDSGDKARTTLAELTGGKDE